ncbi:hypothetical protein HY439_01075 [Candidatus Microgenomates bacterium]|nr:hypothetical protein [Candidatus Microgenomates bacterium]
MDEVQRGADAIYKSRGHIVLDNFLGGIAWGLGTVIGATAVIGFLVYLLSQINFVPGIGEFVSQIISTINQSQNPQLIR